MSEFTYYPVFGELLPNGNLRVSVAGVSPDGEKWDGTEEICPGHSNYGKWLEIITHKERYLASMADEEKRAREEKRKLKHK